MLQVAIIVAVVVMIVCMDRLLQKRVSARMYRPILWTVFVGYLASNLYFTIFSRPPSPEYRIELMPFASYGRIAKPAQETTESLLNGDLAKFFLNSGNALQGIVLNVLLYFPLGYMLLLLFPRLSNRHVITIALAATVSTELIQLIFKRGWCETDDLIHNTLGAVIGLVVCRKQYRNMNCK